MKLEVRVGGTLAFGYSLLCNLNCVPCVCVTCKIMKGKERGRGEREGKGGG
jgi:hypothetical protein